MPIQLDAKLNAFRRSSKGFYITLEIGPDSDWSELAAAPLGQAFGVAMIAYDAETGKRVQASPGTVGPHEAEGPTTTGQQRGEAGKPRRHFDELPLSQQAALLCRDERFQRWAGDKGFQPTQEGARVMILSTCGISSRADLERADYDEYPRARQEFAKLKTQYRMATGQMAEAR